VNDFSLNTLVDSDNGENVVDSSTVFKLAVWTNLRYEMTEHTYTKTEYLKICMRDASRNSILYAIKYTVQ
jgi:hypothetical protein